MAGAMRKMGIYLGLVEDDGHVVTADGYETNGSSARARDYDSYVDDYPEYVEPAISSSRDRRSRDVMTIDHERDTTTPAAPAGVQRPDFGNSGYLPAASSASASYRITTLHPRTYNEARTIGEHFRDSTPVIINLSEMDDADAKRLVDFAAGLTFGLRGSIERVTNKVFLLSPAKVQVTAEDKARIAEGGFFNQS